MIDNTMTQHRDDTVDEAVPEFMAEMVDDLGSIPKNERLGHPDRLKHRHRAKWLLAAAAGALVLIVLLSIAFDYEEPREATDSLGAGLVRIEARLKALETKISRIEKSLDPGLLEKKINLSKSKPHERYHTVRSGDNLSAIASKYGITVDRLCQLNQLTVDQPIKPDQKLLVSRN